MSNERPIEPSSAANQPQPEGGQDFLDLEGELARRRASLGPGVPAQDDGCEPLAEDSWLLGRDGPGCEPWLLRLEDGTEGAPPVEPVTGEVTLPTSPQPLALDTSCCDGEPTTRTVPRAGRRSLLLMGCVVVAIAGVQLYFQVARIAIRPDPPRVVELERSALSRTVLSGPGEGRVVAKPVTRSRIESSALPGVRPAQLDEPTAWDDLGADDGTADPFELDSPAAASLRVALALLVAERSEWEVETELQELKALARMPVDPLSSPPEFRLGEMQAHPPELSPVDALAGPNLEHSWTPLHPALTPRREGPAPVWVGAIDPPPAEVEPPEQSPGDWIVAEAVEKPAVPAAPGPCSEPSESRRAEVDPQARGGGHAATVPPFGVAGIAVEVLSSPPVNPGPSSPLEGTGPHAGSAPLDRPAVSLPGLGRALFVAQLCPGGCGDWCYPGDGGAWFVGDLACAPISSAGDIDGSGRWNLGDIVARATPSTGEQSLARGELELGATEVLERMRAQHPLPSGSPVTDRVVLEPVHHSGPGPELLDGHACHPLSPLMAGAGSLFCAAVSYLTTGELPAELEVAPVTGDKGQAVGDSQCSTGEGAHSPQEAPCARGLTRAPLARRWDEIEVPGGKVIAGPRRVLTPNVGEVLVSLDGGGKLDGTLHAVGLGRVWLDTRTGRMSLEARRVTSLEYVARGSLSSERVCVTTLGGVFVGTLLARDGERITLRTDEGLTLTLTGADVRPETDQRTSIGLRRRVR